MKTAYCSDDGKEVFMNKQDCLTYERRLKQTVRVPVMFLREAIRQCTPYHISSKERTWLKEKLEQCLPVKERPKKDKGV